MNHTEVIVILNFTLFVKLFPRPSRSHVVPGIFCCATQESVLFVFRIITKSICKDDFPKRSDLPLRTYVVWLK